ncbi:hypothetical protein MMC26_003909 [Xylographa opegraphella]|nr:hypothetical protein [Xylographa opegraphella]
MASTAPSDVRTSAPTVKALIESSMVPDRRNTHNLPRRIASDLTAAFCASTLVAQIITIIDKQVPSPQSSLTIHPETSVLQSHQLTPLPPARSIILRTSTPTPLPILLRSSIRIAVSSPHHFLISPPALLVTLLYFGTYTTANLTDTITSTITALPASTVSAGPAKFLATTATNMSLCLYKDAQFARMFGSHSSTSTLKKVVPKTALALFALRDSLTVFASFNVPPLLAPVLGSQNAAQFLAPAGVGERGRVGGSVEEDQKGLGWGGAGANGASGAGVWGGWGGEWEGEGMVDAMVVRGTTVLKWELGEGMGLM